MRSLLLSSIAVLSLAGCATLPAETPVAPESASSLSALVDKVDIPYEQFQLDNGLTGLVHTDRKAPIVGVTTYYRAAHVSIRRGNRW